MKYESDFYQRLIGEYKLLFNESNRKKLQFNLQMYMSGSIAEN